VNAKTTADLEFMPPILETLHLDYSWKTRPNFACDSATSGSDLYDCPFSKDLTLPLQTLLDDVIMRFVKNSLVRRVTISTPALTLLLTPSNPDGIPLFSAI
jgi:hypothetical protein